VGSSDGRDGSVVVHQDLRIYAALLKTGEQVTHALPPGRKGWLQIIRGAVTVNAQALAEGDGAAIIGEPALDMTAKVDGTELLVFDLP